MQSVDRVVRILDGLAREPEGMTVSELARVIKLPIPTTFRILLALAEHALVEHDRETKRYRLGVALVRLSYHALDNYSTRTLVRSQLVALRDRWQESFFYSELVDGHVICLDVVQPNQAHVTGLYIRVGRQMPLHSSASTKAILAYQPMEVVEDLLASQPFTAFTPFTITSRSRYVRSLREVRSLGHAVCDQETQLGVVAVSAPVHDQHGGVSASVTVLGTSERIKSQFDDLVADLLAVAEQMFRLTVDSRPKAETPGPGRERVKTRQ